MNPLPSSFEGLFLITFSSFLILSLCFFHILLGHLLFQFFCLLGFIWLLGSKKGLGLVLVRGWKIFCGNESSISLTSKVLGV